MYALYFGPSEAPLLGLYHSPKDRRQRRGVLLCYPGPEESMRVHWAYRNLTQSLLRGGLHVFRFDYYGTGDSAGPTGEGDYLRWMRDVRLAAGEFCSLAALQKLALVGARLGGSLVAQTALELPGVVITQRLLWDPIVRGPAYLSELQTLQASRLRNSRYPLERLLDPRTPELLGYPLKRPAAASIAALDLLAAPPASAQAYTVVKSSAEASDPTLLQHLQAQGPAQLHHIDEPCRWGSHEILEEALLAGSIVPRLAALLSAEGEP